MDKCRFFRRLFKHVRSDSRHKLLLPISIVLLLSAAIGGTLAYIAVSTPAVVNQFSSASVSCMVNVDDATRTIDVTNTGNINAYIRATFIVNWMDADGNVYGIAPVKGEQKGQEDYYVTPMGTEWTYDSVNDIYYYPQVVKPGDTTKDLVADIYVTENAAPTGYHLSVEVVAEAIQADGRVNITSGNRAYVDAWNVTYYGN